MHIKSLQNKSVHTDHLMQDCSISMHRKYQSLALSYWYMFEVLILLVLKPEYSRITKSIPLLLMSWWLTSPGHQQRWCWLAMTPFSDPQHQVSRSLLGLSVGDLRQISGICRSPACGDPSRGDSSRGEPCGGELSGGVLCGGAPCGGAFCLDESVRTAAQTGPFPVFIVTTEGSWAGCKKNVSI